MTPKQLLDRLNEEITIDPSLTTLTVIRIAVRDLNAGGTVIDALLRINEDLDKFLRNEFGNWLHEACAIARAHRDIERTNKDANSGRGASTARHIMQCLATLNLHDAQTVYGTDGDKLTQYPLLDDIIKNSVVGCRIHHKPYCHKFPCEF